MTDFTPFASFFGGALIGLAALLFMAAHGLGLPITAVLAGAVPSVRIDTPLPIMLIAGLLVGYGTVTGSGCTSGHGVCGLSRLSVRSAVATAVFMASAVVTMFIVRHVIAG